MLVLGARECGVPSSIEACAFAGEPSIVTVVKTNGAGTLSREATVRLEAELRAAGFAVRVLDGKPAADAREEVEAPDSLATIAIRSTDRGAVADIWVADRLSKKTVVRRVDVGDPGLSTAASDLAVRSVELLRASLLEVASPSPSAAAPAVPADVARFVNAPAPAPAIVPGVIAQPPPPVALANARSRPIAPPPRPVEPDAAPTPTGPEPPSKATGVRLEGGVAFLVSDSLHLSPRPYLRGGYQLSRYFSANVMVSPSVSPATLTGAQGSVDVRQDLGLAELGLTLGTGRLQGVLGAGLGVHHLRVDGHAVGLPYVGEQHDEYGFLLGVRAGLSLRIVGPIEAHADVALFDVQPEPQVAIAGTTAGRLGPFAPMPSFGLAARF